MIPWGEPFVLVGSDDEVQEAAFRLKRIGYDAPAGFLQGGLDAWKQANLPVGSLKLVKPQDLYQQMQAGTAPIIVDVRLPTEWMGLRIGNVLNIPLNKLFADGKRLSKDMPVLTVCNSAYRSSMGGCGPAEDGLQERPQHGRRQRGMDCRRPADPERRRERTRCGRRPPREPSNSRSALPPRSSNAC